MAFIQVSFMSKTLMRTVPLQVILPVDKFTFGQPEREEKPFKTLYLLHGIFGNETDWVHGTRIQRWAEEKNLAVVMPAGENAFYVDQPSIGAMHGQFIGEELVEITRKMFPLSEKKTPLSEAFPWVVWRTQKWPEISRYLRGCDLPVRCTSCAGKSGREQSGQLCT